jgi:hypothetical protein
LADLYQSKKLSKQQVIKVLDYSRRTLFAHLQLFLSCLKKKQERRPKPIKITLMAPQVAMAGGLDANGNNEIAEEGDGTPEDLAGGAAEAIDVDSQGKEEEQELEEEEKEDIIDPEDPLYGLEQRLKYAKLDDATKTMVKSKLREA